MLYKGILLSLLMTNSYLANSTELEACPMKSSTNKPENSLFTYDDLLLVEKVKASNVCQYKDDYTANGKFYWNDYEALQRMVNSKKKIWQSAYDECTLPKLKNIENDNAFYELTKICRRVADKESGYQFSQ